MLLSATHRYTPMWSTDAARNGSTLPCGTFRLVGWLVGWLKYKIQIQDPTVSLVCREREGGRERERERGGGRDREREREGEKKDHTVSDTTFGVFIQLA